jgi:hypothetical protein
MNDAIAIINALSSGIIAIALIAAVLSTRVRDGLIIKVGLCSMALGFVVIALHMLKIAGADVQGLARAMLLINSGITVVIIGYLFRTRNSGHALRRITDWGKFDDEPREHDDRRGAS